MPLSAALIRRRRSPFGPQSGGGLPLYGFSLTPVSGGTTASIDVSYRASDITDGTFYFIVQLASVAAPTEAQIKAGQNGAGATANWSTSVAYASIDAYSGPATGLIQDTDYIGYAVHQAVDLTYSNIVSDTFTTTDEVPVLTSPTDASAGQTSATLGVTTDDPNGTLYWVVSTSASAPTATQIREGKMHTGAAATASGSQAITSAGAKTGISATGLTAGTAYYAHFTQRDAALNDSAVVSGDGFTTDSAETVYYEYADDGTSTGLAVITAGTFTTAQSDPDGGSNAILYTCGSAGAGAQNGAQNTSFNYTNAGINKFRFKIKKGSWASGNAYARVRIANMTSNSVGYINLNTAAWTSEGGWSNVSVTDLGSGWISFYGEVDMTAYGDRTGAFQIYMGDATADQTITAAADHQFYIYRFKASY